MRVTNVLDRWPEDKRRRRRWMRIRDAAARLVEELQPFICDLKDVVEPESTAW
jgi:hypothetical protein